MNKKTSQILDILDKTYPNARVELDFNTPYQLLVATVLSAQTTDTQVNKVTKELFKKAPTPEKMLELGEENIKKIISSIGLYNTKSKNLILLSQKLIDDFNAIVPNTMKELLTLAGVGRKTANVVLSNAFNIPAIAVDTHVFRVSKRIGLATGKDEPAVEKSLQKNINKSMWSKSHHLLIFHGRNLCKAQNPKCEICPLNSLCKEYTKITKSKKI